MRAVGLHEAGTEFPARGKLGDLQQERVPAGLQSNIHLIGAGRQTAKRVIGVHYGLVEPDFHAVVRAQFKPHGLFLVAMHPGLCVSDALLAAESL